MSTRCHMSPVGTMSSTASRSTRLRVVEREAVGAATAPVVAGDAEALEAGLTHDLDLVARHRSLRVRLVVGCRRRLRALSVPAQVGGDDGEVLCEARSDEVPHRVCLRVTVQEEKRRPASPVAHTNGGFTGVHPLELEPLEHAPMNARNGLLPTA